MALGLIVHGRHLHNQYHQSVSVIINLAREATNGHDLVHSQFCPMVLCKSLSFVKGPWLTCHTACTDDEVTMVLKDSVGQSHTACIHTELLYDPGMGSITGAMRVMNPFSEASRQSWQA